MAEVINELSPETVSSYKTGATDDLAAQTRAAADHAKRTNDWRLNQHDVKVGRRIKGIQRAMKRLTTEQLVERVIDLALEGNLVDLKEAFNEAMKPMILEALEERKATVMESLFKNGTR